MTLVLTLLSKFISKIKCTSSDALKNKYRHIMMIRHLNFMHIFRHVELKYKKLKKLGNLLINFLGLNMLMEVVVKERKFLMFKCQLY